MKKFSILDICTGRSVPVDLIKETKCYYTVAEREGKKLVRRFHKNTMHIDWEHVSLRVTDEPKDEPKKQLNDQEPQVSCMMGERPAENYKAAYEELKSYSFADSITNPDGSICYADFYRAYNGQINGFDFYTPNDEDWGAIIAVNHNLGVCAYTGFYEMDDMAHIGSGYAPTIKDGVVVCEFEAN